MSPAKFTADSQYSLAEIRELYLELLARQAVAGTSYTVRGKTIVFPGQKEARETIDWIDSRLGQENLKSAQNRVRLGRR